MISFMLVNFTMKSQREHRTRLLMRTNGNPYALSIGTKIIHNIVIVLTTRPDQTRQCSGYQLASHHHELSLIRAVSDKFRHHHIRLTQSFTALYKQATLQHQQMLQLIEKSESEARAHLCHLSSSLRTQIAAVAVAPTPL